MTIKLAFIRNRYGSQDIPVWDILDSDGNIIATALCLRDAWNYYKQITAR